MVPYVLNADSIKENCSSLHVSNRPSYNFISKLLCSICMLFSGFVYTNRNNSTPAHRSNIVISFIVCIFWTLTFFNSLLQTNHINNKSNSVWYFQSLVKWLILFDFFHHFAIWLVLFAELELRRSMHF